MSTKMSEADWAIAEEVFRACLPARGAKGRDDRLFLEALHFFAVHNITWRALPERFGPWNSVWKRFSRLSRAGVFEAFFALLAECSRMADVVQMFDSTVVRAHVSAAGAKGGPKRRGWGARGADTPRKST
jgi:transposase